MRVLMLAQFYPPIIGGEERHVQDLSLELKRNGHEVAVVTLQQPGSAEMEMNQSVPVYRIESTVQQFDWLYSEATRRHAPPLPDPQALHALRRILNREQPDLVHAHNWLLHSFLPLKAGRRIGLVVTLHDYSMQCAKKRLMYQGAPCSGPGLVKCLTCAANHYGLAKGVVTASANWVMTTVERRAVDMFLPVSQAVAEGNGLVGSGLPYRIIPNFIPDELGLNRTEIDSRLEQLPQGDYLLFVGDLSRDKGAHVLLQAYAGLADAPPLVLMGRRCADIPRHFPPGVIFLDSWPHPLVLEAWRRCKVGLAPSVWPEPFGIVMIEAMAMGRPVIASRIGGLPDIIADGQTGLLVPPGDPLALRQALEHLLANAELCRRLGQAGQERVAQFRASSVIPRIEQAYRAVIEPARLRRKIKSSDQEAYYRVGES